MSLEYYRLHDIENGMPEWTTVLREWKMGDCLKGKKHEFRLAKTEGVRCVQCDEAGTLADLDDAAGDFYRMRNERDTLQAELDTMTAEREKYLVQSTHNKSMWEGKYRRNKELIAERDKVQTELQELQAAFYDQKLTLDAADGELEQLRDELDTLQEKYQEACDWDENTLGRALLKVANTDEAYTKLEQDRDEWKDSYSDAMIVIRREAEKQKELQAELAKFRSGEVISRDTALEWERLKAERDALEKQLVHHDEIRGDLADANRLLDAYEETSKARPEARKLQAELDRLQVHRCDTCRWRGGDAGDAHWCRRLHPELCAPNDFSEWDPREETR